MSNFKLLKRKLELETELAQINEKLKAAAQPSSDKIFEHENLKVTVSWVNPTIRFNRAAFEAANPRLAHRLAPFCKPVAGYHTVSKVKQLKGNSQ